MKIEEEPAQHGDWSTRQASKAVDELTAGTTGDSKEEGSKSATCTPSILETLD